MQTVFFNVMGLQTFHHNGTRYYYECLLSLTNFGAVNAIDDVSSTADATWKDILRNGGELALAALEAGEADDNEAVCDELGLEVDVVPVAVAKLVAAPKRAVVSAKRRRLMGPLHFKFPCECQSGIKEVNICIDGFSHDSKNRRCYAQCVQDAGLY